SAPSQRSRLEPNWPPLSHLRAPTPRWRAGRSRHVLAPDLGQSVAVGLLEPRLRRPRPGYRGASLKLGDAWSARPLRGALAFVVVGGERRVLPKRDEARATDLERPGRLAADGDLGRPVCSGP